MIKKYSFVAFCFISLLIIFTGCQTNDSNLEESPAQNRPNSENGITIKTEKEEYLTSVKTITLEIQNDNNEEQMTGVHFFLEKK
ncbi:hypothetical protein [Peribacillus huizhouensis]|uniref:YtkA-like domain-containing protein n=1 Tax=Peribacillus huizhouensis TaxID=1501239 RepID=A0ABR6CR93_9BACI|nr:hypothetical protein [Peribacillus huizhouensis]MBA9027474.1 hypothetical protein [Peribacillus huizhouensis]